MLDTDAEIFTAAGLIGLFTLAGASRERWLPWLKAKLRRDEPTLSHPSGAPLGHRCDRCVADPDFHANGFYPHALIEETRSER